MARCHGVRVVCQSVRACFLSSAGFALPGQSVSTQQALVGLVLACLTAGLFEETGKYICLKVRSVRSNLDLPWLAKFAVGYALCEAVLLGLISHAQLLYFYSSPEVLQALDLDTTAQNAIQKQLASLTEWTALFLLVERIFAILVQVGLTVLGALAVARRQLARLMAAILIHALINIPAASYQYGFLAAEHGENDLRATAAYRALLHLERWCVYCGAFACCAIR